MRKFLSSLVLLGPIVCLLSTSATFAASASGEATASAQGEDAGAVAGLISISGGTHNAPNLLPYDSVEGAASGQISYVEAGEGGTGTASTSGTTSASYTKDGTTVIGGTDGATSANAQGGTGTAVGGGVLVSGAGSLAQEENFDLILEFGGECENCESVFQIPWELQKDAEGGIAASASGGFTKSGSAGGTSLGTASVEWALSKTQGMAAVEYTRTQTQLHAEGENITALGGSAVLAGGGNIQSSMEVGRQASLFNGQAEATLALAGVNSIAFVENGGEVGPNLVETTSEGHANAEVQKDGMALTAESRGITGADASVAQGSGWILSHGGKNALAGELLKQVDEGEPFQATLALSEVDALVLASGRSGNNQPVNELALAASDQPIILQQENGFEQFFCFEGDFEVPDAPLEATIGFNYDSTTGVLTALIENKTVSGGDPLKAPGITGIGLDFDPDEDPYSWDLQARRFDDPDFTNVVIGSSDEDGSNASDPALPLTDPSAAKWLRDDSVQNLKGGGAPDYDFGVRTDKGVNGALYNPDAATDGSSKGANPYYTPATLTIRFGSIDGPYPEAITVVQDPESCDPRYSEGPFNYSPAIRWQNVFPIGEEGKESAKARGCACEEPPPPDDDDVFDARGSAFFENPGVDPTVLIDPVATVSQGGQVILSAEIGSERTTARGDASLASESLTGVAGAVAGGAAAAWQTSAIPHIPFALPTEGSAIVFGAAGFKTNPGDIVTATGSVENLYGRAFTMDQATFVRLRDGDAAAALAGGTGSAEAGVRLFEALGPNEIAIMGSFSLPQFSAGAGLGAAWQGADAP